MWSRKRIVTLTLIVAALFTLSTSMKRSFAQDTAAVPKPQDTLSLGEEDAKQLMLLVGLNKEGKITKKAWINFMSAEFDRLDRDKSGTLDTKELAESRLHLKPFSSVGK